MPPGWDDWASAVYGNPYSEYGYVLNQNQTYHVYQHRPRDYGTDVYVGLTDRFIRGAAHDAPAVLRLPLGVRAAPAGDAGARATSPKFPLAQRAAHARASTRPT